MKEMLETYGEESHIFLEVELYESGIALCESMEQGKNFDLLFLDIVMVEFDGVEAGIYIRKTLENDWVRIIYVSRWEDQALELFQNQPTDFIKKPVRSIRVRRVLDEIRAMDRRKNRVFHYRKGRMTYQVPYREILYFQSDGRKIRIYARNQRYEFNGKMADVLREEIPDHFVRIHKSYIVNLEYVERKTYRRMYLKESDIVLSISQLYRKSVREILAKRFPQLRQEREEDEF